MDEQPIGVSTEQAWLFILAASTSCILGAAIVFVDVVAIRLKLASSNFNLMDSSRFLSATLGLTVGTLLFTSLYLLLPEAREHLLATHQFDNHIDLWLFSLFFMGIILAQLSAHLLHRITPHSIAQCPCTPAPALSSSHNHSHSHSQQQQQQHSSHSTSIGPIHSSHTHIIDEHTPLFHSTVSHSHPCAQTTDDHDCCSPLTSNQDKSNSHHSYYSPCTKDKTTHQSVSLILPTHSNTDLYQSTAGHDVHDQHQCENGKPEIVINNPPAFCNNTQDHCHDHDHLQPPLQHPIDSVATTMTTTSCDSSIHSWHQHHQHSPHYYTSHTSHHHHHDAHHASADVWTETSMSPQMALQTAVAVALHKLPEGMIVFLGAHSSVSLGWSLLVAILVHNIPDGLAISVPVYAATGSRIRAFLAAALLGGMAQPIGALLGAILAASTTGDREEQQHYQSMVAGIAFALGSGVMMAVAVLGAYPAAVSSAYAAAQKAAMVEAATITMNGQCPPMDMPPRLSYWRQKRLNAVGTWLVVGVAIMAISSWLGA
ncbi:Zinc/iron permease [Syncephalis fuscata]|nr:Zinc/iron permease [Syncephalis fuscata]